MIDACSDLNNKQKQLIQASGEILRPFFMLKGGDLMTKEQKGLYRDAEELKNILVKTLDGHKFRLDCGHHITFVDIPVKKSTLSGRLVPMNPGMGFQWFR